MASPRSRSGRVLTVCLLVAGALAAVAWSSLARAAATPPASVASTSIASIDEELEGSMREMNGALKALGKGVTAETRDAALEALSKFQRGVVSAKTATPGMAAKLDEKSRPEFVAGYRKALVEVLKLACDAELAILDGKYKDADDILKNKLMALKKAGHDKYQEEEE